ncbi:MAG: beta-ketoacyl-[acyl-carrier-protein] synthase family protein [Flammeovirgaceae bacterium]
MEKHRVVITGMGVVAPNAIGKEDFLIALKNMKSGITHHQELQDLKIRCEIGGAPALSEEYIKSKLSRPHFKTTSNKSVIYSLIAGMEAFQDAQLTSNKDAPDYDMGIIFGNGAPTMDDFVLEKMNFIDQKNNRGSGARTIVQAMSNGSAAYLNEVIGCGNYISSNSAACSTGTNSVLEGFNLIQAGRAARMLCGSTEGNKRYIWGTFDAMRILCTDSNHAPTTGSRPMSSTSSGFVPGSGAGALILESLESAQKRGVPIYAEVLGGHANSGGLRGTGSMIAPNNEAVQRCIQSAIQNSGIQATDIDLISAHLISSKADPIEVNNWIEALQLPKERLPFINTPKGMIGHCIAAAGSLEIIACVLQLQHQFVHGNLNIEQLHPAIAERYPSDKIPRKSIDVPIDVIIKANFGFGDVNSCITLKKWDEHS